MQTHLLISGVLSIFIAGCSKPADESRVRTADMQIHLKNAQGVTVGVLSLADTDKGVRFIGWARNLPPGQHSIRVLRGAVCDEQWSDRKPATAEDLYFGDLHRDGSREAAEISVTVPKVTVSSLSAGAGSTVVVRANDDDAEGRLACAVIGRAPADNGD